MSINLPHYLKRFRIPAPRLNPHRPRPSMDELRLHIRPVLLAFVIRYGPDLRLYVPILEANEPPNVTPQRIPGKDEPPHGALERPQALHSYRVMVLVSVAHGRAQYEIGVVLPVQLDQILEYVLSSRGERPDLKRPDAQRLDAQRLKGRLHLMPEHVPLETGRDGPPAVRQRDNAHLAAFLDVSGHRSTRAQFGIVRMRGNDE